jgi:hypothetical protein
MPTVAPPRPDRNGASGERAGSASQGPARWPLERVLFLIAGTMTGLSAVLAALVSPWFLLLTGFVAFNQLLYVAVGACPASLVLRHFGVRSGCAR